MSKHDRRDPKDASDAPSRGKPPTLPEPPPFDPDYKLIGNMERAERPGGRPPRWVRRLQRRADA